MSQDTFYINGIECEDIKQLKNLNWSCKLNEVELILTPDKKMFHAKYLMTQLCDRRKIANKNSCTKTPNDWLKHEKASYLKYKHPEWFEKINNKWFFSLNVLYEYALSCNSKSTLWLSGDKDWRGEGEGYIYFVKPSEEKIQTKSNINKDNIYKVGRSWSTFRPLKDYGKNVQILKIFKVSNQYKCEKKIIKTFDKYFDKAPSGDEYYFIDDIDKALHLMELLKIYYIKNNLMKDDGDIIDLINEI